MTSFGAAALSPEYPVLGLLIEQPCHGYELNQRVQEQLGELWHMSESQLYSLLDRLEDAGLLRGVEEEGHRRPDRYVFHPTAAGRDHFQRWLREPSGTSARALRIEFLTRLYFARRAEPEFIEGLLSEQRGRIKEDLTRMERRLRAMSPAPAHNRLALELRIIQLEAILDWLPRAQDVIPSVEERNPRE